MNNLQGEINSLSLERLSKAEQDHKRINYEIDFVSRLFDQIAKAKDKQDEQKKIDLSHLEEEIHQFRELWDAYAIAWPNEITKESNPFKLGLEIDAIQKNHVEYVLDHLYLPQEPLQETSNLNQTIESQHQLLKTFKSIAQDNKDLGFEMTQLMLQTEEHMLRKMQESSDKTTQKSNEVTFICNLLSNVRDTKQEQEKKKKVDLSHLKNDITKFCDLWDSYASEFPEELSISGNPFSRDMDFASVDKEKIEKLESKLRIAQMHDERLIQKETVNFERLITMQKQILEICKSIEERDADSKSHQIRNQVR